MVAALASHWRAFVFGCGCAIAGCSFPLGPSGDATPAVEARAQADASCAMPATQASPTASASDARDAGADRPLPTVSLMTWNLDWFQDPQEGPADDAAQYTAVREILASHQPDLLALEELSSEPAFDTLLHDLPGYGGVLSGYAWTQRTALLWHAQRFELQQARAISGFDDAGRPPLEVRLRDKATGQALVMIVIHAKAQADVASYDKRVGLARALERYLDSMHPGERCVLLGDFNDKLVGSITHGASSPYQGFVDDSHYDVATLQLDPATASYATGSTIDHIIVSDELASAIVPGSVQVLRTALEQRYPRFTQQVSDHFPVTLRLAL